jgi:hypothetical protein
LGSHRVNAGHAVQNVPEKKCFIPSVSNLCCRAYRIFDWSHPPLQQDSILFATLMDVVSDTGDVDGGLKCALVLAAM